MYDYRVHLLRQIPRWVSNDDNTVGMDHLMGGYLMKPDRAKNRR